MKKNILVIDDETNARAGLRRVLESLGCNVFEAASGMEGIEVFKNNKIDLIITDLRMPGEDGMSVLNSVRKEKPNIPVILITAYGSGEAAKNALANGAYDFISKPFDIDTIELVVRRALKLVDLKSENESLKSIVGKKNSLDSIIGNSPPIKNLFQIIKQVAPTKSNVLIEGESGTGKELIAHAIHNLSPRHDKPFIPVHCASFQETLLESELFGHEKGAFTGAVSKRLGRFELADKGTLFLDEVSSIPLSVQVKLLRVLQERTFERVGGSETIKTDVRIVAATNIPLEKLINEGRFREDLYYRLNVVNLKVPPLRERPEDIKLLINHFLERFNRETGKNISISSFAEEILESYAWPGNVRELQNTIESLVVLCQGHEITPRDLPAHILGGTSVKGKDISIDDLPDFDNMTIPEMEKWMILRKLSKVKNKSEVAKQLGISRRNLYRRLNEYNG